MRCGEARLELPPYISGELNEDDAEPVIAHLASCEVCRQDHDRLTEAVAAIKRAVPSSPPLHVRDGVMSAVLADTLGPAVRDAIGAVPPGGLRETVVRDASRASATDISTLRIGRPHRRMVLGSAAVAAALALLFWVRLDPAQGPSSKMPTGHDVQHVSLAGDVTSEATLTHYRHDNYRLLLSVDGYPVTPPGSYYAVWLRGTRGDVPLGGFRLKAADDFEVPFAIAVDPAEYPEVAITLEPVDGDPSLTGDIVSSTKLDVGSVHHGTYDE